MLKFVSAAVLLLFVSSCNAGCTFKDAKWKNRNKAAPAVSQPSRNDPTKVLVSWRDIMENANCVDSFVVLVWADGQPASSATKYKVDKTTTSKIVDVQACVTYKFAVEIHENEKIGGEDVTKSGEASYKTAGAASNIRVDASRFLVSYYWDPVKRVTDLRTAVISLPRDLLKTASCLDYIQVTGEQVRARARSGSVSSSRGRTFSWNHLGKGYNPAIQAGGASTLPAAVSRNSYSNAVRGRSSSTSSTSSTSSSGSWRSSSSRSSSTSSTSSASPISAPAFANTLPRQKGGAAGKVGPIRAQPPFLKDMIQIKVPVKDCSEYNFEVKFFGPGSKQLGVVTGVKLPALADVPGYVPPPLTSVMSITYSSNGKAIYGVKTSSGVNSACLPAYYEAYDAYTHRLENEVNWATKESQRGKALITNSQKQLGKSQEELLKKAGCVCTSSRLTFTSTDSGLLTGRHGNQFGDYEFQGMYKNRPFYKLVDPRDTIQSGSRGTTRRPTTYEPVYLFWDDKKEKWTFGPGSQVGDTSDIEFATMQKSLAKCPADPPATGNWAKSGTFRWSKKASLKVTCGTN